MKYNVCNFEKPNFELARSKAYELLINQKGVSIGMKAESINIPNKEIIFDTLQNYCNATGSKIEDMTCNGKIKYGLNIGLNNNTHLILHNSEIFSKQCQNWTKIHEIAHICIEHEKDEKKEEVEANFFVSCFLMPDCIIRTLKDRGCKIDIDFLMRYFNVSKEAATKKINTLRKCIVITKYDNKIIKMFENDMFDIKVQFELDKRIFKYMSFWMKEDI